VGQCRTAFEGDSGLIVNVKAVPRSSKSGIDGWLGGALKVRVKCAPVDGKANKELVEVLADAFELPKSSVRFVSGETSKTKRVELVGVDEARLKEVAP